MEFATPELKRAYNTAKHARWRNKHKEQWNAYMRNYWLMHPEVKARHKVRGKAANSAWHRRWKKEHPAEHAAKQAEHRALRFMATPPWVDRKAILKVYQECRHKCLTTGIAYEVDHIWPLHGEGFVGLHVPWNLQIITSIENSRKGNKRP